MEEPINHHFVSECHLKEFFNNEDRQIYLFDKQLSNYYQRSGTKRIFSEKDLNTRLFGDKIDSQTMEIELKVLFEDDFSKHLASIIQFHQDQKEIAKIYEDMNYLALMALIGEYRNPEYKSGLDQAMNDLKKHFTGIDIPDPKLKYQNTKGYIDVGYLLLKDMDPITFALVSIESNDHFIVPDTSGFLVREHLDIGHVMQFGLPVSDKLFLLGRSTRMGKYPTTLVSIKEDSSELVFRINSDLINYAYKTVACKDQLFLQKTIDKMLRVKLRGQYFQNSTIGHISNLTNS
jgi:hypothetical protein